MKQIIDMFFDKAYRKPDKCAICCEEEKITYADLAKKVTTYSNEFANQGIKPGDHIGIPMNNSIQSVAIMLAAADMGCVLVPINPTFPCDAVEKAFVSGNVKHIIAKASFLMQYQEWGLTTSKGCLICTDKEYEGAFYLENATESTIRIQEKKTGNELFILTMTSGSTGSPKPIALTQNNKLMRALAHIEHYGLTEDDVIMAATPLYHSLAERLVLMPLMIGATSVILPRFTPNKWIKCIHENKVTFTIAVSAQLGQVAELLSSPLSSDIDSLRCIVSSSALLEPHIKKCLIDKLSCDFHEMYGTSETSTVTDINLKECISKQGSVGKPMKCATIKIIASDGTVCKAGEVGEINCKTDLLCEGYYGIDRKFKEMCENGYFKTGDLGYLDEDGYLYYSGRKKEIIITGGINVYPKDIEGCVMKLESVQECAAFPYPDDRLGEVVAIAIVRKKDTTIDIHDIRVQCAKNLADFQQPHKIFFLEELPKNAMGKMVKGKILEIVTKRVR